MHCNTLSKFLNALDTRRRKQTPKKQKFENTEHSNYRPTSKQLCPDEILANLSKLLQSQIKLTANYKAVQWRW